ncbi:MAG: undecaprenyl-diphosphate phosphatase [Acutalibacteraceae bacterium]|nr:undecaprenyl-diphosphate phosphatase [Acutalibacteraceae bacterium]HIR03901.1 undecaprenyl-diphosphate phosphatase [Candidatus Scatovicinus merdipullorum]
MNIFDAIIQGIVQGLTEFLPVSSSGHLAISQHILGVTEDNLFFNVMLHVGTLVAVCAVYYKLIIRLFKALGGMVADICRGKFKWSEMDEDRNLIIMLVIGLLPLFLLFVPLPFSGGLAAKDLAEIWSGNTGYFIIVGISLIFTCILLTIGIFMNRYTTRKYAEKGIVKKNGAGRVRYNILDALCVGIAQFFAAIFPGLSRSGSTLAVGQLRGINKQAALDYTFILAIPSILAAALMETIDAVQTDALQNIEILPIIVGVITSAVVGFFAILLFKWMLAKDRMYIFVIYTAVVGVAVIVVSLIEMHSGTNLFTGATLTYG